MEPLRHWKHRRDDLGGYEKFSSDVFNMRYLGVIQMERISRYFYAVESHARYLGYVLHSRKWTSVIEKKKKETTFRKTTAAATLRHRDTK